MRDKIIKAIISRTKRLCYKFFLGGVKIIYMG